MVIVFRWSIDVGWSSTWVKIVNEWLAAGLYSKFCFHSEYFIMDGNRFASIKRPVRILGTWRNIRIFWGMVWSCFGSVAVSMQPEYSDKLVVVVSTVWTMIGPFLFKGRDFTWDTSPQLVSPFKPPTSQRFLLKPTQVHTGFYAQVNSCSKGSSREIQWFKA